MVDTLRSIKIKILFQFKQSNKTSMWIECVFLWVSSHILAGVFYKNISSESLLGADDLILNFVNSMWNLMFNEFLCDRKWVIQWDFTFYIDNVNYVNEYLKYSFKFLIELRSNELLWSFVNFWGASRCDYDFFHSQYALLCICIGITRNICWFVMTQRAIFTSIPRRILLQSMLFESKMVNRIAIKQNLECHLSKLLSNLS